MKDAANELGNDQSEEINQCAVSCDGTWQKTETFLEWVCDNAVNGE